MINFFVLFQEYVKAKMYLSRGKAYGNFNSSLQLIKVECLLQSVHEFPYVQTLNDLYDVFPNPNTRVIILLHILVYYNYCEKIPKEMMHYLKLYIDLDIADIVKKRKLMVSKHEKYFVPIKPPRDAYILSISHILTSMFSKFIVMYLYQVMIMLILIMFDYYQAVRHTI